MRNAKKGNKVKCINNIFKDSCLVPFKILEIQKPKKGETYTIREIIYSSGNKGILLEEVINPKEYNMFSKENEEPSFKPKRFKRNYN